VFPTLLPWPGADFELPGGFRLPAFGPMVALGFLVATWLFGRLARRYDPSPEHDPEPWAELPVWILIGILVGARALYVIVEILRDSSVGQRFVDEPWTVLFFWQGGLVMYGGLAGGILGGLLCVRRRKIPFWHGLDLGLSAAWFGLAIGRIGCFLVGDDYGQVVPEAHEDWPFPLVLHVPDPLPEDSLFGEANAGRTLYATQLWMSFNALLMGIVALFLLKRRTFYGQVALIMVAYYAVARSVIEAFRGDEIRGTWFDGAISTSQLISIGAGLGALALLFLRRSDRVEPSAA